MVVEECELERLPPMLVPKGSFVRYVPIDYRGYNGTDVLVFELQVAVLVVFFEDWMVFAL